MSQWSGPSSDDVFGPRLLGARVKNTFVDVPLYTPDNTKRSLHNNPLWTCPAHLSKSLAFEETPEPRSSTTCTTETPGDVNSTPQVSSSLVPPTPSPEHAWEFQRQRMPIRMAPLSFDAARQSTPRDWPPLFEHPEGLIGNLVEDMKVDKFDERSQDGSD